MLTQMKSLFYSHSFASLVSKSVVNEEIVRKFGHYAKLVSVLGSALLIVYMQEHTTMIRH